MPLDSRLIAHLERAQILDIELDGACFRVYVAQREADVEYVAELVPEAVLQGPGNVHVAAIHTDEPVDQQIQDVLFNLDTGDSMVFLCPTAKAYADTLTEFGQSAPAPTEN